MPYSVANLQAKDDAIHFIAVSDARLLVYSPKYTFMLSYFLTVVVMFFLGAVEEHFRWPNDPLRAWTIPVARGFGYILNLNIALEFLLASRMALSLLRNTVLGTVLPIDQAMPAFHVFVGYVSFVAAVLHGIFHCIGGIIRNMWTPGFGKWTWCVVTGLVLLSLFALMLITAVKPMRNANFERFMYVHLVGAALFFPLICLHGFYTGDLYTYKWVVGPAVIYVVDRVVRKLSENSASVLIQVNTDSDDLVFEGDIVRLAFPRPFKFRAGQYAEICVPSISTRQWHPFSIASAPNDAEVIFFIKKAGDWTSALYELCRYGIDSKRNCPVATFDIIVRGPFGAPAQHVGQYEKILLISGGVGATPFCSITKDINDDIARRYIQKKKLSKENSQSSLTTVASSLDSGSYPQSSFDGEDELPNISEAGLTLHVGIHRPKRVTARERVEVFKHPTIRRNYDDITDLMNIPTQTWCQFLHSLSGTIFYNTLVLWLLLIRFAINLLGVAFREVDLNGEGTDIFKSIGMTIVDFALSFVSVLLLVFAVIAELCAERRLYVEDITLLIPLSLVPIVFHFLTFLVPDVETGRFAQNLFYIAWPATIALNLVRYFRVLGRRAFLSESVRGSYQSTKSVDFIWTTPTSTDDIWLIEELQRSIGKSKFVRLFRFITREAAPGIEAGYPLEEESNEFVRQNRSLATPCLCRDHYGRPDWRYIFEKITSNSKNGTTIGIFFCGPMRMGAEVEAAAMHSMLDSRYRGLSNRAKAKQHLGISSLLFAQGDSDTIPDALSRSFNVRYVFREEKF